MLQLCRRVEQPGIAVHFLNIDDGVPLDAAVLRDGVQFIREQKAQGKVVLSAFGAGISRSVTFAIATLKEGKVCHFWKRIGRSCIFARMPDPTPRCGNRYALPTTNPFRLSST